MARNRLYCRGFLVQRWRVAAVGLVLGALTFFGTTALPGVTEAADRPPCWDIEGGPRGVELCRLVDRARDILSRLKAPTAGHLRKISAEFELERSLRIQQALFREDLQWLSRGYTERQMDVMVFVAVSLSLERAADLSAELSRACATRDPDPKTKHRLEAVRSYQRQAAALLERLSRKLGNVQEHELKFYF